MSNLIPSSQVQKNLEIALFKVDQLQRKVDEMLTHMHELKSQAEEIAVTAFGPELAPAALKMATMSLPAIWEITARNEVALPDQRSPAPSVVDPVPAIPQQPVITATPTLERDGGEGSEQNPEFFDVDVPASRVDEGYAILSEVLTAYRQNQKFNPYSNDRGKNSWRKQLFAKALEHYYENGLAGEEAVVEEGVFTPEVPLIVEIEVPETGTTDAFVAEVVEVAAADDIVVPSGSEVAEEIVDERMATESDITSVEDEGISFAPTDDGDLGEGSFIPEFDDEFNSVVIPDDETVEDDVSVVVTDDDAVLGNETGDDFAVGEDAAIKADHTFELTETFFSDDVPEEVALSGAEGEEDHHAPEVANVQEPVPPSDVTSKTVVADDMVDAPALPASYAARVVAMANVPPAMRPRTMSPVTAPKPQEVEPSRQTSAAAAPAESNREPKQAPATAPVHSTTSAARPAMGRPGLAPARPTTSVAPVTASTAAETKAAPAQPQQPPRPAVMTPATRPGMVRPQPEATATRQHGYGNAVPAPDGLEQALEEKRKAEEAKARTAEVSSPEPVNRPAPPPFRPSPIARPGFATPMRK